MIKRTEEFRARAIQIAEKIRKSLDDEAGIVKEIMNMRFALLTEEGLTESEIRLSAAYIDLVMGLYHDRTHLECMEFLLELEEEGLEKKEMGH